jgi:polysaccharide export outer membrane protein
MKLKYYGILVIGLAVLQGCKSYTSNIILKADADDINWKSTYEKAIVEYPIRVGDKLQFSVFTNQGESIIDPSGNLVAPRSYGDGNTSMAEKPTYDVLENGTCHFPLIGNIQVIGFKVSQLDSLLSKKYEIYYNGVYVLSKVTNKKIIMIGSVGGKIVPYTTNMNLLEAIAIYGGLESNSKGYNIRIVRGDLKNPEVSVINLRSIKDMQNSIVNLRPDDIIYIEPVRRPGSESIRDNLYIFNIIQVIVTMVLLVNTIKL